MKESTGFGLITAFEITISVILAALGVPGVPEFFAGVGGFFLWGTLEALEDEK